MSDYLTDAANRADPFGTPAIRPRVRSVFEGSPPPAISNPVLETPAPSIRPMSPTPPISERNDFEPLSFAPQESSPPIWSVNPQVLSSISSPSTAPASAPISSETVDVRPVPQSPRALSPSRKPEFISPSIATKKEIPQITPDSPSPLSPSPPAQIPPLHSPSRPLAAPLLTTPKAEIRHVSPETASSPPAVNVTIGRLEIRAAPVPEKPRRPPQPAAHGPLALDDFLRSKSSRALPSGSFP